MIRLTLIILFLIPFFTVSLLLFPLEWIIGKFSMEARHKSSLAIVQWAFKVIIFISGAEIIVKGYENLLPDKAVLYVGNHRSFFDIIISYSMMPGLTGYVSKKEIKKVPILYHWMLLVNCLFLDRHNIKEGLKAILEGIDKIKSGISIFIFPEGTRSDNDLNMLPFKEGSLKMAVKTGCPIIPVAFNNTSAILEDHFPKIKKAKVIVEFGKPIDQKLLSDEERKFLGITTQNQIRAMLEANIKLV